MKTAEARALYVEMLTRWLRAKREWPFITEPEPQPVGVSARRVRRARRETIREFERTI